MAEFAPEAKYEMRKLSDLTGWVDNPRTATRDAIERLKKQIDYLGLYKPLLINQDNIVLGGNMRLEVLRKLKGEQYEVMCSVVVTDNIAQMMDYALSDNDAVGVTDVDKVTEFATLNPVRSELFSIQSHPGTIVSELVKAAGPDSEEDEAPEVSSEPPVSKLGEVYQLGRHRIMCADSTVKENVEKLMDGKKADVAITDPPYGINIVQNNSVGGEKLAKVTKYSPIENDDGVEVAHKAIEIMKETTENQIVFGGNYFADKLEPKMCWVVWDKDNTGNFADCELAWTSYDKAAKLYKVTWNGMIREGESGQRVHPTQKPIKLFGYIIKDFDPQSVQDLFLGSGSTLIACEQTDRTCYGMELDEKYLDVIRKRWAKYVYPDRWEKEWEILTPAIEKL